MCIRDRYNNMHYVAIAGGNAFYEKRKNPTQTQDMFTSRPSPRYSPRSIAASMAPAAPRPAPSAMTIEELIAQGGSY